MPQSREDQEGILRLLGVPQEWIEARKGGEERRAWRHANRGPTPEFFYESSETDFGDAPLSPPRSPPPQAKSNGPDLSRNAWKTRLLRDLGQMIGPEKTGFGDYEVWKRHVLSEYAESKPKLSTKSEVSSAPPQDDRSPPRKKRRSATLTSERISRSKVSASSLFYELDHDGKTAKCLLDLSLIGVQKGYRSSETKNHPYRRKERDSNRVRRR